MSKEKIVQQIEEIDEALLNERYVLLYLYTTECSVCDVFRGKLTKAMEERDNVVMLSAHIHHVPLVSGRFMVFSSPCVLFFVDGKESLRNCGVMSLSSVTERIDKLLALSS